MDYKKGAGGTPGGLGQFFIGLIMSLSGGYMLTTQIRVTSGFFGMHLFGGTVSAFGATLIPFMIGVGLIFFDGRSKIGWALTSISLFIIIIGVLVNLRVYFANTSLYVTLIMLVLLVGGLGLMARALKAQ
jgi:hypothetical protein